MALQIPIVYSEVLNLCAVPLSISLENVQFSSCTMESDRFITICETGQSQIAIVDLQAGHTVTRQKISAEAAIMNPLSKVIALKAGQALQIFNLELRAKIKSYNMPAPVTYWRWISPNSVAIITATSVFHWSIEGDSAPLKIFDRNPAITEGNQIINYQVSNDHKWCLLCGICVGGAPGVITGNMQLYSMEKSVSQMLQGHCGVFSVINIPGRDEPAQVLCFEDKKPEQPAKLFIMEVGRDKSAPGGVFRGFSQAIPTSPDTINDFPVTMNASKKHGIVYMISEMGYLSLFDIFSGKPLYRVRITMDTVFAATEHTASGGILVITHRGKVLKLTLNENTLIPYIVSQLRDHQLAFNIASRLNLFGADEIIAAQFNDLILAGDIEGAAWVAADSPKGLLRTPATIARFQQVPTLVPGQPIPIFQYFSILLEKGKLNHFESIELSKSVIQQGRGKMLEKWIAEDKLELSEELGDLLMTVDVNMALSAYLRTNKPEKVINCYIQRGEFDKIVPYALKANYQVDYVYMLQQLVRSNPSGALEFAKRLATNESGVQLIHANTVLEVFMSNNLLREATAFLLEALKGNRKEEGFLQTKILEINFLGGIPQVADAILGNAMFSHYDKPYIGKLCEQYGLPQRALEHYTEVADIKRVLQHSAGTLNLEFIVSFFGTISRDSTLEILKELLSQNMRQNLPIVVQVTTKYSDSLGPDALIKLFEDIEGISRVATDSSKGLLHTLATRLQQVPPSAVSEQSASVFQHFINHLESIELRKLAIQQAGDGQILADDKQELSEELGDLLFTVDINMALTAYLRAKIININKKETQIKQLSQTIEELRSIISNKDEIISKLSSIILNNSKDLNDVRIPSTTNAIESQIKQSDQTMISSKDQVINSLSSTTTIANNSKDLTNITIPSTTTYTDIESQLGSLTIVKDGSQINEMQEIRSMISMQESKITQLITLISNNNESPVLNNNTVLKNNDCNDNVVESYQLNNNAILHSQQQQQNQVEKLSEGKVKDIIYIEEMGNKGLIVEDL